MHKNRHENFTARKQRKREKRTRFGPKKAKPGAFWVLEGKTAVKTSCGQMWEDSNRCNIRRNLVDRVQGSIGTKKPQTMRFSQGLGTSGLAGAEGLEPSARGFGVDVGECSRERGRGRFRPVLPDKSQKSGAGLVLRRNAPKLSEPKRGGQSAGRVYFL